MVCSLWLQRSVQTLVAINSESLCAPSSEAAMLFDWKLSRLPFTRAGRLFRSAALHRTRLGICWFVPIMTVIEILIKAMSAALVGNKFSRNPSKFHFSWKKICRHCPKYTKQWNLLNSQSKSVFQEWQHRGTFSQASRSRPASTAASCVSARRSEPPKLCRSAAPRAWPLTLQSKPSIVFCKSLWEWLPDDRQGLELGLKRDLCCLTNAL